MAKDVTKFGQELFKYKDQCTQTSFFSRVWSNIKSVTGLISKDLIPEIKILEEAYDWGNVVYHSVCFVQYCDDPD